MNFPGVVEKLPPVPLDDVSTASSAETVPVAVPRYLEEVYTWAYLNPRNVALLDRPSVVNGLLFGNARRLTRAVMAEIGRGDRVLLPAHVYGNFVNKLAAYLGPSGELDVIDVAPVQVARCRRKVTGLPQVTVRLADAADPGGGPYDAVTCFFLLHEVPDGKKRAIIDGLLGSLEPRGKAVFVDYHRPHWWHPLRPVLGTVNACLEPFAKALWRHDIAEFASRPGDFTWSKRTYFGGLYQKVVARRG